MGERGNYLFRQLDWYGGIPLSIAAGTIRKLQKSELSPPPANRIGVLCLGAIGDLLLASALINGLALKLKNAQIELISSRSNSCALELIGNAHIKSSFPVSRPWKILNYLRQRKFDLLIDTTQWAKLGAILSHLSRARYTVGFDTPGQYRGFGYDKKIPHKNNCHELENFLSLGRAVFEDFSGTPSLAIPENLRLFKPGNIESKNIYLHMWPAPGKGFHLKIWPAIFWARLAQHLLGKGFRLYLTGSANDAPKNDVFLREFFGNEKNISSIAGQHSFVELAVLLESASALISVNTGTMHLGALAGCPTIGLHGPTNPLRWGPLGKNSIALVPRKGHFGYLNLGFEYSETDTPCLQWLPVEDVLMALEQLKLPV